MWYLKFKCKHSDCIYSPKLQELKLNVFFHHLGHFVKENYVYTSAIQHLIGKESSIKKYISYMKNHEKIVNIEVYENVLFTLAKHRKDLEAYAAAYNTAFIYPAPSYLDKNGFEVVEIACWQRKFLQELINTLKRNNTTTYFEILKFANKKMNDIYVSRLLPNLPAKQDEAIKLAFRYGYYKFPKETNLDKLANMAKVSKPTFRESLKKAEAKLIPRLISE